MELFIALACFAVAACALELTPRNVDRPTRYTEQEYEQIVKERQHKVKVGGARAIGAGAKIINGEKAKVGQFPWQVSITMGDSFFCSGSIISENWVMTAGHCVDDDNMSSFELVFGSITTQGEAPGTLKQTSRSSIIHEDYTPDLVQNDIGLIRIMQPLNLTVGGQINSVRLPTYSQKSILKNGNRARISGWGKASDELGGVSDDLYYADLEIVANSLCGYVYGSDVIAANSLCASGTVHSVCTGDSGGPLVFAEADGRYTQVGIASFGSSAGCSKDFPLAFARVTSYLGWIAAKTGMAIQPDVKTRSTFKKFIDLFG